MRANEYQKAALRTANTADVQKLLLNGILGLCGEAGETADYYKKHLFQGHPFDPARMAQELGDQCWYLAVAAYAIGYSLEDIMEMNIAKLWERYPEGFDAQRSLHRKEEV